MPLRVLDESGSGTTGDVDAAIHWAVDHGADVVNLSLSDGVTIVDLFGGPLTESAQLRVVEGRRPGHRRRERRTRSARSCSRRNALFVTATGPDDRVAPYANSVGFAKWGIAAPGGTERRREVEHGVFDDLGSAGTHRTTAGAWGRRWRRRTSPAPRRSCAGSASSPQQTVDRLLPTAKDLGGRGYDSDLRRRTARRRGGGRRGCGAVRPPPRRRRAAVDRSRPSTATGAAPTATARSRTTRPHRTRPSADGGSTSRRAARDGLGQPRGVSAPGDRRRSARDDVTAAGPGARLRALARASALAALASSGSRSRARPERPGAPEPRRAVRAAGPEPPPGQPRARNKPEQPRGDRDDQRPREADGDDHRDQASEGAGTTPRLVRPPRAATGATRRAPVRRAPAVPPVAVELRGCAAVGVAEPVGRQRYL